jgi:phage terminase small subunit
MLDYMKVGPDGDAVLDFSKLTRDHGAALIEVTVEDFKDGRGEDARDVRPSFPASSSRCSSVCARFRS